MIEKLFFNDQGDFSIGKAATWALVLFVAIFLITNAFELVERNGSGTYQVRQSYWDGELTTRFSPGIYGQWLGIITTYKASASYKYTDKPDEENVTASPIIVRFNDGGRAKVYGDVRFTLPANDDDMANIQKVFGSHEALMKELYSQIVKESVVMTAALMSSEESYASKRSQFSDWVGDQIRKGIYITAGERRVTKAAKKGDPDIVEYVVNIKRDPETQEPIRKETVVSNFGIGVAQCIISDIIYLDKLDEMIGAKRDYLTKVIAAKSSAERARQEMKTAAATGKQKVEVARYTALENKEQITSRVKNVKEKALIAANRDFAVSKEHYEEAKNLKAQYIFEGQGQAKARALALAADGAIQMKKQYHLEVWQAYRDALKKASLVPDVAGAEYAASTDGTLPGLAALNAIDRQLQSELGINLTFHR